MGNKFENGFLENDIPYFMCPNEVFDKRLIVKDCTKGNKERNMDCQEKLIFIFLIRCSNGGKKAFPSYNSIAERCCCSRRKATYAIQNLFESGYIVKKNRGFRKDNTNQATKNYSNIYSINYKKLQE